MAKTHKHLKAFAANLSVGAMLFAFLCTFASPVTALAAGEENQLEIVVPTEVVFTVNANGNVIAPTNWQITNNSEKDYILDNVRAGSRDVPVSIKASLPLSTAGDEDWFSIENKSFKLSKNFVELAAGTALNVNWSLNDGKLLEKSVLEQFQEGTNKLTDFTFFYIPAENENWPAFAVVYQDGYAGLYKRNVDPQTITKNTSYDGRLVQEVITGIENKEGIFDEHGNITTIEVLDSGIRPKTTRQWFRLCRNLTSVDLANLNMSSCSTISEMFNGCTSLRSVEFSSWNTPNLIDMRWMFNRCLNLESIDLSALDISNVLDMQCMFDGCTSLKYANLSGLDASKLKQMYAMFRDCHNLISVDFSGFVASNLEHMEQTFRCCYKLESIDLSVFSDSRPNMYYAFGDCKKLKHLDLANLDLTNCNFSYLCLNCESLETINLTARTTSLPNLNLYRDLVGNCPNLHSVTIGKEWNIPLTTEAGFPVYLYDEHGKRYRCEEVPLNPHPKATYYTKPEFVPESSIGLGSESVVSKSAETNVSKSKETVADSSDNSLSVEMSERSSASDEAVANASNLKLVEKSYASQSGGQGTIANGSSSNGNTLESPPVGGDVSSDGCSVALPVSLD